MVYTKCSWLMLSDWPSVTLGFPSHPHSITSWHQSYLPQWRDSHSLRFYSGGWVLRRCVSKTHWVRKTLATSPGENRKPVCARMWLTIGQKYVKSELKTPKRVTIEENQWWKLMAIYRTCRQTDRHTHTYIHTQYKHIGIVTSEGMQWNQSGE